MWHWLYYAIYMNAADECIYYIKFYNVFYVEQKRMLAFINNAPDQCNAVCLSLL